MKGTRHMPGSGRGSAGPAPGDAMLSCHVVAGCTLGSTGERRFVPAWEPRCMPSYSYPSPLRFHCFFSAPTAVAVSRTRGPAAAAERGGHATATRPLAA